MPMDILAVFIGMVLCYLLGSINFAVVFSYIFEKKDVRKMGSGNAGMTNVMRSIGVLPGILTFVFDFLKGAAAVILGRVLLSSGLIAVSDHALLPVFMDYLCGISCQLGHIFPIFMGFKGGKGVSTSLAILFMLDWKAAIVALVVFLVVMSATGIVSASSILGTATAPFSICVLHIAQPTVIWQTVLCTVLASTIIIAHKQNIIRIFKGEEKKLSIKSTTKKTLSDK